MSKWKIFMMCLMVLALLAMPMLACGDGGTEYELTISVDPEGGGTTDPSTGTYTHDDGDEVTITATAADGYEFESWSGDVTGSDNPATIIVDEDKAVTANFTETTSDLTMIVDPAGSGTTDPAVGVHKYDKGTVVEITATPAEGWNFDKWLGLWVTDKNSSTTTVPVNTDTTVTATFIQVVNYTLTMEVAGDGNGSTDPAVGEHEYAAGTTVPITADPDNDSYFIEWTGEVADPLSDSTTVTMDAAKTVTANFGPLGGPEVSIVKPLDDALVTGTVAIEASVTDDLSQIVSADYRLDDGDPVAMTPDVALPANTVTFTASLDSTTAGDGYHKIYIRATNDSGLSTTKTVAISVRNLEPAEWTYEVTFVSDQLTPVIGTDTEVTTWVMSVAGMEELTTDYFSGDCIRLHIDYGDPDPLRFKNGLTTWLVFSDIWTDVVTGKMMRQKAEILMPGGDTVIVMVTNEWLDDLGVPDTYVAHTVLEGLSVDVPDEFHQIVPVAVPQVVHTGAGDFLCDVTEDYIIGEGRLIGGPVSGDGYSVGTGDGTKTTFNGVSAFVIDHPGEEAIYVDPDGAGVLPKELQIRGTDYNCNYDTGAITFTTAPADGVVITGWFQMSSYMTTPGDPTTGNIWKINYVDHITPGYGLIKQIDYMYGGTSTDAYGSTQVLEGVA